jgi:hypothetical protein
MKTVCGRQPLPRPDLREPSNEAAADQLLVSIQSTTHTQQHAKLLCSDQSRSLLLTDVVTLFLVIRVRDSHI